MAYQYAKKGACLVLVARRKNSFKEVAEIAKAVGSPDVLPIAAKPEDCRRFIEAAVSRFSRLDHLASNAGIVSLCMFEDITDTDIPDFNQVMDVYFWGSVYPSYFAVPYLRRTGGRVVMNASASGWSVPPRMSFYNASKAALISFYETLQAEFGPEIEMTIATPGGWAESQMIKGKHLRKEGVMCVEQIKDSQLGPFPVWSGEKCTKAIMDVVCRGNRYMADPTWFRVMFSWKLFAPEVMQWSFHFLSVPRSDGSAKETWNKHLLDVTGAKGVRSLLQFSLLKSRRIK